MEPRQENRETPQGIRDAASDIEQRRKKWISQILTELQLARRRNNINEGYIYRLRLELEKYKALLRKHSHCSLTRTENQGVTQLLSATPSFAMTGFSGDAMCTTYRSVATPCTNWSYNTALPPNCWTGNSNATPSTKWTNNSFTAPSACAVFTLSTGNNGLPPSTVWASNNSVASTRLTAPLASSEGTSQRISKPVTHAVLVDKEHPATSSKSSTAIDSSVESEQLKSITKDSMSHSSALNTGVISNECPDLLLTSQGASDGIPNDTRNLTSHTNEPENCLKVGQVLDMKVNSGQYDILNKPIARYTNTSTGRIEINLVQENENESSKETFLINSLPVSERGDVVILENADNTTHSQREKSTQVIQAPKTNCMGNGGISLSLEKTVTPVEEMTMCPDKDDDITIIGEVRSTGTANKPIKIWTDCTATALLSNPEVPGDF